MKQEVSYKITYFNLFMALAIVFYHWHGQFFELDNFTVSQPVNQELLTKTNIFFNNIGGVAVSYFFVLSGFLFYRDADDTNVWKKMRRRIYTLGAPFVLWNAFKVVYDYAVFRYPGFSDWKGLVLGFTLEPFDGPLWHMLALLFLMLVAPVLVKVKKNRTLVTIVLFALVIGASVFRHTVAQELLAPLRFGKYFERLIGYFPMYFLGVFLGMFYHDEILFEKYTSVKLSVIAFVAVIACGVVFWNMGDTGIVPIVCQRIQMFGLWICLGSELFKFKPLRPFKISVVIYALHQITLIPVVNSWVVNRWMNYSYGMVGHILLAFAAVLVLYVFCVAAVYMMKLVLNEKLFNAMSGGRI